MHYGHLKVALDVKRTLNLDRMLLMPAARSPLKAGHSATVAQRLDMLQLALEEFPDLAVDRRELERAGASYTIDSLVQLRNELGDNARLYFVLGDDLLPTLNRWSRWRELTDYANLVVTRRPGHFPPIADAVQAWLDETRVDLESLQDSVSGGVAHIQCSLIDVSSTALRREARGNTICGQVIPPPVMEYINQHQLYRTEPD